MVTPITDETQLALLAVKQEIYGKFIGIFATVLTILAAVAGIAGVGLYEILRRKVDEDYKLILSSKLRFSKAHFLAFSYNEDSFGQWRIYEPTVQKCLDRLNAPLESSTQKSEIFAALSSVDLAIQLVNRALIFVRELDGKDLSDFKSDFETLHPYLNLLNGQIYAQTSRAILLGECPSSMLIGQLNSIVDELLEIGLGEFMASKEYSWWEAAETCGFFYVHVGRLSGDAAMQAKGIDIISSLATKKRLKVYLKPLPSEVSKVVHDEYVSRGYVSLAPSVTGDQAS
ncbi:hypothetical protein GCM10011360_25970 [Primorskyibacter flagellatus]|uniref:Uncharacterized protein n=1 Tax=Primorskyibacter flagellatus TaxID=1387277 RepID=A0A917A9T1_9RHOB|nr:hypothetical protein GCM10011360_25970 [Primorskyibacter flagellatus]